jgi:formylglycine-generating enzyme required for sulfatase activity
VAAIFLSHRSTDDGLAKQLEAWLHANGFEDVFADHDKIRGGDKWRDSLRRAKGACRVVLCLVTPDWLESDECFGEFSAAWYQGKRIIPLMLMPRGPQSPLQKARFAQVLGEDFGVAIEDCVRDGELNFARCPAAADLLTAGLRAGGALAKVGLDPYAFEADAESRPDPFPGLESFDDTDADAAIFFGRSLEISLCIEELREMRATGDRRAYAIQGASGSGKSSLLKAGVLPRLRRERGWLVLRCFRPGADPLHGFANAIARTASEHKISLASGVLCDNLLSAWRDAKESHAGGGDDATFHHALIAAFETFVGPIKNKADRATATVLVAMDQGEELARCDGESGDALSAYLRALLCAPWKAGEPPPYALTLTVRDDSFPELRASRRFEGVLTRTADIRTLPIWRFSSAIEEPASRYRVEIDPQLVQALMDDAPDRDALPLVAFAMRQLWMRFAAMGEIRREHYESLGKLTGLMEYAAERALRGMDPADDRPHLGTKVASERERRAAHIFVPALAQLNERGSAIRRVASLSRFDAEDRLILEQFQRWYLVTSHGETIEVAHESMFREWPRFQEWLAPERSRLEALRGLESAAASWNSRGRNADDLLHRGRRLTAAKVLRRVGDYKKHLESNAEALAYLDACTKAEHRRLAVIAAIAVLALSPFAVAQVMHIAAVMHLDDAERSATRRAPSAPLLARGVDASALSSGATFRDCNACPEMMVIGSGRFEMGSNPGAASHHTNEAPAHRVNISRFAIGQYAVTFAQWDACVAAGGCNGYRPDDGGYGRGNMPVINIDQADARAYAAWLTHATGQSYRLLSEAEWEYAARGGKTTPYYTGDSIDLFQANFNRTLQRTRPVGSYPPNPLGLYDMAGNVWTWVDDCWHGNYNGAPSDGSAWRESDCHNGIIRGGAWGSDPIDLRLAMRTVYNPDIRIEYVGIRVARDLTRRRVAEPVNDNNRRHPHGRRRA